MATEDDFSRLTDVAWRKSFEAEHGLFIAEGRLTIERALAAGLTPRTVLTSPKFSEALKAMMPTVEFLIRDDSEIEQVTGYQVHRGALASFERPKPLELSDLPAHAKLLLVLEDLVDHENVGTLIRSAAALGVDAVILSPTCADPLYRRSIKTSMGSVFHIPWLRARSTTEIIDVLRKLGVEQVALTPIGEQTLELETDFPPAVALWLGNEGDGLSKTVLEGADRRVAISMHRETDSVNVAAAGAIAMWQVRTRMTQREGHL